MHVASVTGGLMLDVFQEKVQNGNDVPVRLVPFISLPSELNHSNAWETEKANDVEKEHFGMKRKEYRKYKKEGSCKKRKLIWEKSVRC